MKRSVAFLLVVVLVLAMMPAASAVAQKEDTSLTLQQADGNSPVQTAALLEAVKPNELRYPGEADLYNYIIPDYEMYGMTVLRGDDMKLRAIIGNCFEFDYLMAVLIYEGLYEDIAEDAEPVAYGAQELYNNYNEVNTITWKTSAYEPGDYTVFFCLIDEAGEVYHASVCDVFISNREIPLERLGIYVLELGREADTIYDCGTMSLIPIRYPYHTTNRDKVYFMGDARTGYGSSNFPSGAGVDPNGSDITAYLDDGGAGRKFQRVLTVLPESERPELRIEPLNGNRLCFGMEAGFRVHLPEGVEMEDLLIQHTMPDQVELRVEGNIIYVKNLWKHVPNSYLIVSWENCFAAQYLGYKSHELAERVEKEPTCTEPGLMVNACVNCGQWNESWEIPALGHEIAEPVVVSEPTATKDGLGRGVCARCELEVEVVLSRIFIDTLPDQYYSDALDYCYANGIINGMTNHTFGPGESLSRGQLVTMLYRHAGSPEVTELADFTDVPAGQYYTEAVAWANANGIVKGYDDGTFKPNTVISREQIVTMLHRYVVMLGADSGLRSDLSQFDDLDQLSGYAWEAMQWAVGNGVINGMDAVTLGPLQNAKREQTVTILYRIITGVLAG